MIFVSLQFFFDVNCNARLKRTNSTNHTPTHTNVDTARWIKCIKWNQTIVAVAAAQAIMTIICLVITVVVVVQVY